MIQIVAPVCSCKEAEEAIKAGAKELYCGFLPQSWQSQYGQADIFSRRQGALSHVTTKEELEKLVAYASENSCEVALTMNKLYTLKEKNRYTPFWISGKI